MRTRYLNADEILAVAADVFGVDSIEIEAHPYLIELGRALERKVHSALEAEVIEECKRSSGGSA